MRKFLDWLARLTSRRATPEIGVTWEDVPYSFPTNWFQKDLQRE